MQDAPLSAEESLRVEDLVDAIIKNAQSSNVDRKQLVDKITIAIQFAKIGIDAAQHKEA